MCGDSSMFVMIVAYFIVQVHSQQLQPAQHGSVVASFNDVISNRAVIISFNGLSKIKCAAECFTRTECHSFFYSKSTYNCQLHSAVLNWYTSGRMPYHGSRYYGMQNDRGDFRSGCPSWAIKKNYKYESIAQVCYYYYMTPLEWNEAWEVCANDGGHLLSYTDHTAHTWAVGLVSGTHTVFIDGYDQNNNDNFKNYKNDPVVGHFWGPHQPNNRDGQEDCIVLHKSFQYKWGDIDCSQAFPFVCQIDLNIV